jgi:hypothetical protein
MYGTGRIQVTALMLLTLLFQEALDASELPGPLFKSLSGGTPAARSDQAWTISLLTAGLMVGHTPKQCLVLAIVLQAASQSLPFLQAHGPLVLGGYDALIMSWSSLIPAGIMAVEQSPPVHLALQPAPVCWGHLGLLELAPHQAC